MLCNIICCSNCNNAEFTVDEIAMEGVAIGDINAAPIAGYEQVVANVPIVSSRATRYNNSDTYS